MPLLIQRQWKGCIQDEFIYIPLCLYLYHRIRSRQAWWISIYIPLCLYLYRKMVIRICKNSWFTFHYASTYTKHDRHYIPSVLSYIYIPLCLYLYVRFLMQSGLNPSYLHSTMPLLIQTLLSVSLLTFLYLHSTMPLLILLRDFPLLKEDKEFTFHYASTYTIIGAEKSSV